MEKTKNCWVTPTNKPSRLWMTKLGNLTRCHDIKPIKEALGNNVNIYITNDEKIKEGDWYLNNGHLLKCTELKIRSSCKKIILTTDLELQKDDVQAIDDEFLEWFVKNPNCESVEINSIWRTLPLGFGSTFEGYKIIIPKEDLREYPLIPDECFKQERERGITITHVKNKETLEKAAREYWQRGQLGFEKAADTERAFSKGAKWQQERSYSEEDIEEYAEYRVKCEILQSYPVLIFKEWFNNIKKK